ncbi:MAG: biotin synthase BioB [Planctomycetaceae bacterium]
MNPVLGDEKTYANWHELAERVLQGEELTRDEALAIVNSPDAELLDLLAAAYKVRRQHFGRKVHLYYLKNAKSGLCPEDCGYCSQSIISEAPIERYALLNTEKLMAGARQAAANQARTYCIVASGRGPSDREVEHIAKTVEQIKSETGLHICCCLGLLNPSQAERLKSAGVDRINHNLNTSRRFYDQICSTHSYQDRIDTLKVVRDAGMELCCGVIVGMGEESCDLVDLAFEMRDLNVESIPVNFLNAIDGTPLEGNRNLNPRDCLRALALFRLTNPRTEIRIAGGREVNLRSMQALGLYPANSLFVSDYLTTKGQPASEDFRMIEDLGFEVITGDHESYALWKAHQPATECETKNAGA